MVLASLEGWTHRSWLDGPLRDAGRIEGPRQMANKRMVSGQDISAPNRLALDRWAGIGMGPGQGPKKLVLRQMGLGLIGPGRMSPAQMGSTQIGL